MRTDLGNCHAQLLVASQLKAKEMSYKFQSFIKSLITSVATVKSEYKGSREISCKGLQGNLWPQYTNMANMKDLPCIQHRRILLIYQSFCSLSMLHCLLMHLLLSAVSYWDHKRSITQVYVKDYNRFLKTTPMHNYLDVHKYFSCDDISA